jgi:hypothetical protein
MFHHVCLFHKGWWKLIILFGFALQGGRWEASKCTRCRGHVWGAAKFYFLRDSAQKELQHFPATCNSAITTPLLHKLSLHILFPSSLLCFQVFHKYRPITTLTSSLQPPLSIHTVHWFRTSCWVQYIWINLAIYCKCFNIISLNSVVTTYTVERCSFMLLLKFEVCFAHYLVENKIWPDPRHVLCNAKQSMSILVFSPTCGQNKIRIIYFTQQLTAPVYYHHRQLF